MEGGKDARGWACAVSVAFAVVASAPAPAADEAPNVRLTHNGERFAVARALSGAMHKLGDPVCQTLLDEFKDASGRPLRSALEGLGMSAPDYLRAVFFYDGPGRLCGTSALAVTTPGSRAVFVCGARFVREMKANEPHAEGTLIHEMLHSLGLGENPPSSDYINTRVRARCGTGAKAPGAVPPLSHAGETRTSAAEKP
jgi:hypothetical protein